MDLNKFISGHDPIVIGRVTEALIHFLKLEMEETDILFWKDRITHIEEHKNDFKSEESYLHHLESIPIIVQFPDYVGYHEKDKSLQFIKRIDVYTLVAIRVSDRGKCNLRTMFPVTPNKLASYLASGRVKKYKLEIDSHE